MDITHTNGLNGTNHNSYGYIDVQSSLIDCTTIRFNQKPLYSILYSNYTYRHTHIHTQKSAHPHL